LKTPSSTSATESVRDIGTVDGPLLVFGGPYSNLQATTAMLEVAHAMGFPPARIVCTGDVVAYCADAAATVRAVRRAGIHIVMGNCEESLGLDLSDCGCGFAQGSACDSLSRDWFAHARAALGRGDKAWMAALPRRLTLTMNGRRLAVIHGGASDISRFVFASSPAPDKAAELDALGVDGVIAGHCGLPFSQRVGMRLWHNAGVIAMPANDGTARGWFSMLTPGEGGISVAHHPLAYDHARAALRMTEEGMAEAYARTLCDGLWPNMDVLPALERARRGRAILPSVLRWAGPAAANGAP